MVTLWVHTDTIGHIGFVLETENVHITGTQVYCLFLYIDIDECNGDVSVCHHKCTNTIGSFECSCHNGYHLTGDGRTCTGIQCISVQPIYSNT